MFIWTFNTSQNASNQAFSNLILAQYRKAVLRLPVQCLLENYLGRAAGVGRVRSKAPGPGKILPSGGTLSKDDRAVRGDDDLPILDAAHFAAIPALLASACRGATRYQIRRSAPAHFFRLEMSLDMRTTVRSPEDM